MLESELLDAIAVRDSRFVDPEIREEAGRYVDAVFNESVRQIRIASLERKLAAAETPEEIRSLAREVEELQDVDSSPRCNGTKPAPAPGPEQGGLF